MARTTDTQLPAKYTIEGDTYRKMCDTMNELALRGPHEESLMLRVANAGDIGEVTGTIRKARMMRAKFSKRGRAAEEDGSNVTPIPPRRRRADRKTKPRRKSKQPGSETTSGGGSGSPATGSE